MEFKLILVAKTPDEYLLYAEKPLSGLALVEKAGACLRRNLDTQTRMRHITLGNIAKYELSVPQAIAIESGWFTQKSSRYIQGEMNVLEKYIFYGATMGNIASNRPVYPYYTNEVVVNSYIDELAVLETWRNRGYPNEFTINYDEDCNIDLVPDADDIDKPDVGDMVLDDMFR